jgi:hypothetical protein
MEGLKTKDPSVTHSAGPVPHALITRGSDHFEDLKLTAPNNCKLWKVENLLCWVGTWKRKAS